MVWILVEHTVAELLTRIVPFLELFSESHTLFGLIDDTDVAIDQLGQLGCRLVSRFVVFFVVIHKLARPRINHLAVLAVECLEQYVVEYRLPIATTPVQYDSLMLAVVSSTRIPQKLLH